MVWQRGPRPIALANLFFEPDLTTRLVGRTIGWSVVREEVRRLYRPREPLSCDRVGLAVLGGRVAYRIELSPECEEHLRALTARDRSIVLDALEGHLAHQPTVETRHRKLMRPNPIAPWELRLGDLRVYYDVEDAPEPLVHVRAVGVKHHNELRIAGRTFTL